MALTSPTSGVLSVAIVRSRTKTTEYFYTTSIFRVEEKAEIPMCVILAYSATPPTSKTEETRCFETSANLYQNTRCHIPDDSNLWPILSSETTHSFNISVQPAATLKNTFFWPLDANVGLVDFSWTIQVLGPSEWCRHNDCLLALELNHIISGPFSIIWRWQPFQNTGELSGTVDTLGRTDTEHTHTHTHTHTYTEVRPGKSVPQKDSTTECSRNKIIFSISGELQNIFFPISSKSKNPSILKYCRNKIILDRGESCHGLLNRNIVQSNRWVLTTQCGTLMSYILNAYETRSCTKLVNVYRKTQRCIA
jgi:hypothetical protein